MIQCFSSMNLKGRSYDGNDWERPAGKMDRLSITCDGTGSSRRCQIIISKPKPSDDVYHLTSYHSSYTTDQKVARFLERATYGTRRIDLSSWDTSINLQYAMTNWVKDQIDNKVFSNLTHI